MAGTTDTVKAKLTPGEFVIRKEAVDMIGVPMLNKLNDMPEEGGHSAIDNLIQRATLANMKMMYGGGMVQPNYAGGGMVEEKMYGYQNGGKVDDAILEAKMKMKRAEALAKMATDRSKGFESLYGDLIFDDALLLPDAPATPEKDILRAILNQALDKNAKKEDLYEQMPERVSNTSLGQRLIELDPDVDYEMRRPAPVQDAKLSDVDLMNFLNTYGPNEFTRIFGRQDRRLGQVDFNDPESSVPKFIQGYKEGGLTGYQNGGETEVDPRIMARRIRGDVYSRSGLYDVDYDKEGVMRGARLKRELKGQPGYENWSDMVDNINESVIQAERDYYSERGGYPVVGTSAPTNSLVRSILKGEGYFDEVKQQGGLTGYENGGSIYGMNRTPEGMMQAVYEMPTDDGNRYYLGEASRPQLNLSRQVARSRAEEKAMNMPQDSISFDMVQQLLNPEAAEPEGKKGLMGLLGFENGGPVNQMPEPTADDPLQIDYRMANPEVYQGSTLGVVRQQAGALRDSIDQDTANKARKALQLLKLEGILKGEKVESPGLMPQIPSAADSSRLRDMLEYFKMQTMQNGSRP